MKYRPFFWIAIFFISGIITGYYLYDLYLIFIIISIFLMFFSWIMGFKLMIIFLIIFLTGFSWLFYHELIYNSEDSIARWNDRNIYEVKGEIQLDLQNLEGEKVYLKPYFLNEHKILYGLIELEKRYLSKKVENGDLIKIKLQLHSPEPQINPGGFSNFKHLKKKGVYSLGFVKSDPVKIGKNYSWKNSIIDFKYILINLVNTTISNPEGGLIKAILLGERENLSENWQELFSKAGASHLLAISGLHVGFITLILFSVFKFININLLIKNILISSLLVLYMIISGGSASVTRAGSLSILFLWAPFFNREGDLFNILGICIFINLMINPYSLFTPGLQLSYGVLIIIILWTDIIKNYTGEILAVSIAAQIGSIPVTAYYFNEITPIGIITNIWAIPLTGILVLNSLIGLITGLIFPWVFEFLGIFSKYLILFLEKGLILINKIPNGSLEMFSPGYFNIVIIYVFLIYFSFIFKTKVIQINKNKQKQRVLYCLLIIFFLLILNFILPYFNKELEIIFFAVDQGDGILVKLPGNFNLLIDGGGVAGQELSKGRTVILPYLKQQGIKKLDMVFITHLDSDHALGVLDIIKNREVDLLLLPSGHSQNSLGRKILTEAEKRNIQIKLIKRGDIFKISEIVLEILNPDKQKIGFNRNENSIVIKLIYNNFKILFTGDLEKSGENEIMELDLNLRSDILKLGHHGSNTSTQNNFLNKVDPAEAVISVGKNNFYGHPHKEVLEKLKTKKINVWRTDKNGAIIIKSKGNDYRVSGFLD